MADPTEKTVTEATTNFTTNHDQAKQAPHKIDDAFTKAIAGCLAGGIAGLVVANNLRNKKRDAADEIKKLLKLLTEVAEGINAPYLFVQYAASWQRVGGEARAAYNDQFQSELSGYWQGPAALKYNAIRQQQAKSLESADKLCDTIHTQLLALASSGQDFYNTVAKEVAGFLSKMTAGIAKLLTIVEAPWGASDTIDAISSAITAITNIQVAVKDNVKTQIIARNELENAANQPYGFPGNAWPKASPNEYSDATVQDGTNSWSVPG